MKPYIQIYMIDNGYLAQEMATDGTVYRAVYLKDINMETLLSMAATDHEAVLRGIIRSADGKIAAIKAVRTYIRTNNMDRSDGLKDVKDFVEAVRSDWPISQWRA